MAKKSWMEKFNDVPESQPKMTNKGMMYISTPKEIAQLVKKVPKGKLITTKIIVDKLTKKYKVDFTCPMTTGIFVSVLANASEEQAASGKGQIAPYWRVVRPKGELYDKYLTHQSRQEAHLKEEGFKFDKSYKKPRVKNWEEKLVN